MSIAVQPREIGRARTLIAAAGLVLLALALWFPRSSFLHGAGVLIGLVVLAGVRYSNITMSTASLSLLTTGFCVAGAFSTGASRTLGLGLSLVGVALAIYLAAWHLTFLLKKRSISWWFGREPKKPKP